MSLMVSTNYIDAECKAGYFQLNQKTAWYMAIRVRKAMGTGEGGLRQGIVEKMEILNGQSIKSFILTAGK